MVKVSEARLRVWLYKFLMGNLSYDKTELMFSTLEAKQVRDELEPLERRVWAAKRLHPDNKRKQRDFVRKELDLWEKRTSSV